VSSFDGKTKIMTIFPSPKLFQSLGANYANNISVLWQD